MKTILTVAFLGVIISGQALAKERLDLSHPIQPDQIVEIIKDTHFDFDQAKIKRGQRWEEETVFVNRLAYKMKAYNNPGTHCRFGQNLRILKNANPSLRELTFTQRSWALNPKSTLHTFTGFYSTGAAVYCESVERSWNSEAEMREEILRQVPTKESLGTVYIKGQESPVSYVGQVQGTDKLILQSVDTKMSFDRVKQIVVGLDEILFKFSKNGGIQTNKNYYCESCQENVEVRALNRESAFANGQSQTYFASLGELFVVHTEEEDMPLNQMLVITQGQEETLGSFQGWINKKGSKLYLVRIGQSLLQIDPRNVRKVIP